MVRRQALTVLAAFVLAGAGGGAWARPAPAAPSPASRVPEVAADADAGGAPRVAAVELVLPHGEDRSQAAALLAVAPGDRLSRRALRTTVQRLFQSGRFKNVQVRGAPAEAPAGETGRWVRLTVEAEALRRLARVEVKREEDGPLDDGAIRAATRFQPGDPLDDLEQDAAADRVREALAKKGYRAAVVIAEVASGGEARVVLTLTVRAGAPTRVREVRVDGAGGVALAPHLLSTQAGAVLDAEGLAADVKALRKALTVAGYRRARVGAPEVKEEGAREVVVIFPVTPGPRMTLAFRGNGAFPGATLKRQLGFEPDQPLDATALDAAAERLRIFYRSRGFAAAQVEVDEVDRGPERLVVFHVVEGQRYRLAGVQFDGAAAHGQTFLRGRLREYLAEEEPKPDRAEEDAARLQGVAVPPAPVRPSPPAELAAVEYFEEAAWDRAAERIAEGYRGEGYLEALYLGSSVELDAASRTARVTLRLREGPLTRVEEVRFEGNEALSTEELAGLARLRPGDPLAYALVEETRSAVLRRYASRGRVFAHAETAEQIDPQTHLARLTVRLEEGPQVRVGRILIGGNGRTRDRIVREALALREGDVYDPEAAARSQSALLDTGVFRSVSLRLQDPDVPAETKDLVVDLVERPYASLTAGAGYSLANGPRTGVEYVRPNVMGRAVELAVRGKVNYPNNALGLRKDLKDKKPADRLEGKLDVGFRTARLSALPFPAAGRANLIGELVHRPAYDLGRVSIITGIDAGITSRVITSLQYELEVDDIKRTGSVGNLTQVDAERLRFDEGTTTLHAVRETFTVDLRDNSAHPHRGFLGAVSAEYAHSLGGPAERGLLGLLPGSGIHTNLVKVSATLSGYVPLGGQAVLALSARAGRVFALDPRSRTIVPRRFFLGGASTLRGFGEEQLIQSDVREQLAREAQLCATSPTGAGCTDRGRRIAQGQTPVSEGGEAFVLGKAEVRLPVAGRVELGLFFEAGELWLDPNLLSLKDLRPNAGVGLRFVTPIGPAALDLGFNLRPDRRINEATFAPHFTIGLF